MNRKSRQRGMAVFAVHYSTLDDLPAERAKALVEAPTADMARAATIEQLKPARIRVEKVHYLRPVEEVA